MNLQKIKGLLLTVGCTLSLLTFTTPAYSGAVQIFSDLNYANPADLSMIKKGQIIVGTGVGFLGVNYTGTSFGVAGQAKSNTSDFLSYGQAAWRISPKIVVAMAITQPVLADLNWGPNSFISSTSVGTVVKTVNFAPRFSYQVTQQLSLGFGLDLEDKYTAQLDFQVPGLGVIQNHSSGFEPGFDFGAFYIINPKTFVSASFYSPRHTYTKGKSTSTSGLLSNNYSLAVSDPLVVQLHLTRLLTQKLALSGGVYYSHWGTQHSFDLQNTVLGNLSFINNWFDIWSFELGGKYDLNDKLSLLFGSMYETNFAPSDFNSIAYPGAAVVTFGGGLKTQFNKHVSGQLIYAYKTAASGARFTNAINTGSANFHLNIVAARLTYDF